jgi:tripartite-type tricarboxylate transporter receptor subunit TctC
MAVASAPVRVTRSALVLRRALALSALLSVFLNVAGFAADYPTRPIRIIVAFTAGGSTDTTARLIAANVQRLLGEPIVIENKPGANGAIAAQYVAQSEPDGYTLFFSTVGAIAVNPAFHSNLSYDPLKDFAPVGKAVINSPGLVVNADMKVNSARELTNLARKKPGAITVGITGRGAKSDLGLQLYEEDAGIQLQTVPYRGAAQAITDVIGGHLDGMIADMPTVMSLVQGGKVKPLATSSEQHSDIFPNVPTFAEQGYADAVSDNWTGVLAPAATPEPVIAKFNAAMVAALNDPALRERLHKIGTTPAPSSPQQFGDYMRAEIARWATVIKEKGLTGE